MFAVCVRWIMLLSFAAHAALGCCIHHEHACRHGQALQPSAADPIAVTSHSVGHCCSHHRLGAQGGIASEESSFPVDEPVPAHHDDNCDEATCSFLSAASSSSQFDESNLILSLDWIDSSSTKVDQLALANNSVWRTSAIQSFVPLKQFCAWQNSWQL